MNMSVPNEVAAFEELVRDNFSYLETEFQLRYSGVREVDSDTIDRCLVASYVSEDDLRLKIAWSELEKSLIITIRLANDELSRKDKYIYFEPYLEFTSAGEIGPIVPQIYPGMSTRKIGQAINQRVDLFDDGPSEVVKIVAKRLQDHFGTIELASAEIVREYHQWFRTAGKR